MGRKSKRIYALTGDSGSASITEEHYKAGIYARLSVDKEKKKESIDTQVEIAEQFVKDWNEKHTGKIKIAGYYKDLGKTGTNFERDEFTRLMQDVRLGDINCIIVKDLSRFGRNYLEAGSYIEKIFPFLGVRFIAVADGYDTGAGGSNGKKTTNEISLQIKNLVNDMYAKDISVKTRTSFEQRRKEGSYVGGPPPYGYIAVKEGKIRKLIPDEKTAGIVRDIFLKFLDTKSYKAVADNLNMQRINPPSIYRKSKEVFCPADVPYKGWDKAYMEAILRNETYIGRLVQGKTSILLRKERKSNAKEEWIIKEKAHEPLVEVRIFEEAEIISQEIHNKWKNCKHQEEEYPVPENVFEEVLFCGVCGREMTRHSHVKEYARGNKKRVEEYLCLNAESTKTEKCHSRNYIAKNDLMDILFSVLEVEFSVCLKRQREYERKGQEIVASKKQELEQKLNATQRIREKVGKQDSEMYVAYRAGRLSQEELTAGRQQREEKQQELLLCEAEIQKEIIELEQKEKIFLKSVKAIIKLKKNRVFTKEIVNALIDKIYIYPGKRVEVVFTFREAWKNQEEAE